MAPATTDLGRRPRPAAGPRPALLRLVLALSAALLTALSPFVASASAGTYDVWSCKTPSGQPTSTTGWTPTSSLLYDRPANDCALGGRLSAKFTATGGGVSGGLASRWYFTAPEGTTVKSAVLNRAIVARTQPSDQGAVARAGLYRAAYRDDPAHRLEACDSGPEGCDASGRRIRVAVNARAFGFSAGCAGESGASLCARGTGSRAGFAVDSARITLQDDQSPTAKVTGRILTPGYPLRGRPSLKLSATDVGSGVWQAEVRLGAKVVQARRTVSSNRGRCQTLPGSTAFGSPVPCASAAETTLAFRTKGIKDGPQLLTVTVWDAANNPTVAVSTTVSVDNARRVQADGTILMPPVSASTALDEQLLGGGTGGAPGSALRPASIPSEPALARVVEAMNTLADARIPYCYGGGHGSTPAVPSAGSYCWQGNPAQKLTGSGAVGLDCSSSVSWVLQQAGYGVTTMTSGNLARLGEPGPGKGLTIWANAGHVYLEVVIDGESFFWGTAASNPEHGPGWHPARSSASFTARHIPGL